MGRGNYGWFLRNVVKYTGRLLGIEVWAPYVAGNDALAGANRDYYDDIIVRDVRDMILDGSLYTTEPTTVFAFDVIEHFRRSQGIWVLSSLIEAAEKEVLVSLPIVPYPQEALHGNDHEKHLYDWSPAEMQVLGGKLTHSGVVTGMFVFDA